MNLKILNLSANKVDNFLQITHIKYLNALEVFKLEDENYGTNPLCEVDDYMDKVISLKPNLIQLDFIALNPVSNSVNGKVEVDEFDKFNNKCQEYNQALKNLNHNTNREVSIYGLFQNKAIAMYDTKIKDIDRIIEKVCCSNEKIFDDISTNIDSFNSEIQNELDLIKKCVDIVFDESFQIFYIFVLLL